MKKTAVLSGLMALTLLLGGCSAQQAESERPTVLPSASATVDPAAKTSGVGFYFDTVVTVTLYGADDALLQDIWKACERYENMLSKTVEGSDVSRINHADGQTVTVDAETWNVLSEAKKLNRMTGGAFAITIAPLTAQWDFTGGTNRMPTDEERLAALPLVDDEKLTLGENNTVTLPAGMQIDLGGIAKGYIADQVAALVRGRCSGAMLNFGGNVYAVGTKPDGSAYRVGVQDPDVLSAIRNHTLGRRGMSPLETLIFVSDFIEPNRAPFEGLEEARTLAETDLRAAARRCAELSNDFVLRRGGQVHPRTAEMLKYWEEKE